MLLQLDLVQLLVSSLIIDYHASILSKDTEPWSALHSKHSMSRISGGERGKSVLGISQVAAVAVVIIIAAMAGIATYALYFTGGSVSTSTTSSTSNSSTTSTSTQTNTSTSSSTQNGVVSVLMSDPPHVPDGVGALFISYANMFVHVAGLPDGEGWVPLNSSGSIELMDSVNVSQTIASASIPTGTYNMFRFNVTAAQVTYNSQNYSAFVQTGNLTIHFIGFLSVSASQPAAMMVDVQPFVFNFGNTSDPVFVIKPSALCFPVPSGQVTKMMQHLGYRFQIHANQTWFWQLRLNYLPHVNLTSASLSNMSLSMGLENLLNQSAMLRAVIVTPLASGSQGMMGRGYGFMRNATMPAGFSGSAVFLIQSNGTLRQLTQQQFGMGPQNIALALFGGVGYNLAANQSVALSYSGLIQLGLRLPPAS